MTLNIYKVPLVYEDEGLGGFFVRRFFTTTIPRLKQWREIVEKMEKTNKEVDITIAGKYVGGDSYISINEALKHAGAELGAKVNVHWIDTESIEREPSKINEIDNNGVIVPGGFGTRGTEGKIAVIKHLREQKIPYLGLCFGFQLAVVEFARSIGLRDANSTELNQKTMHPVICLLPEQKGLHEKGGTMRLGAQPIKLRKDTKAYEIYNRQEVILERHRHRYEVNPAYIDTFEEHGLIFSGKSPDGKMEIVELKEHPFFIATQFHPEFKSRPGQPSPLFSAFVATAIRQ
jgi:CTP synthase